MNDSTTSTRPQCENTGCGNNNHHPDSNKINILRSVTRNSNAVRNVNGNSAKIKMKKVQKKCKKGSAVKWPSRDRTRVTSFEDYRYTAGTQNQTPVPRKGEMPDGITRSNSIYHSEETFNEPTPDKHILSKLTLPLEMAEKRQIRATTHHSGLRSLPNARPCRHLTRRTDRWQWSGIRWWPPPQNIRFFRHPAAPGNPRRPGNAGPAHKIRPATPYYSANFLNVHHRRLR